MQPYTKFFITVNALHVSECCSAHHQELKNCTHSIEYTWSVRKVSDRIFLCEHLMDYNLARLHEPTLNLSAHA